MFKRLIDEKVIDFRCVSFLNKICWLIAEPRLFFFLFRFTFSCESKHILFSKQKKYSTGLTVSNMQRRDFNMSNCPTEVPDDSVSIDGQIGWREALPTAAPSIRHSAYYSASSVISPFQFGSARTRRRIAPFHSTRVELPCVAGFKVSFSGSRPTQSNFMGHLSDNGKWGMFIHQCCVGECFHGVRWRVRWDGAITLCCCGSAEVCCRLPLIISDTFVCVCVC